MIYVVYLIAMIFNFYYAASHEATDYYRSSTFTAKTSKEYNKVIRNEYVISSTNLEPEYYQKHKQSVPIHVSNLIL